MTIISNIIKYLHATVRVLQQLFFLQTDGGMCFYAQFVLGTGHSLEGRLHWSHNWKMIKKMMMLIMMKSLTFRGETIVFTHTILEGEVSAWRGALSSPGLVHCSRGHSGVVTAHFPVCWSASGTWSGNPQACSPEPCRLPQSPDPAVASCNFCLQCGADTCCRWAIFKNPWQIRLVRRKQRMFYSAMQRGWLLEERV